MSLLPISYDRLERWFPSQTGRAAALGVSRELVRTWDGRRDRGARPTVRARTAVAIERIATVADQVERLVGDPAGAGSWLLAPQPALRGESAAAAIRAGRIAAVMPLLGPSSPAPRVRFTADEVRAAAGALGADQPVRRERPRDPDEAAVLRLLGEDERMIGPLTGG